MIDHTEFYRWGYQEGLKGSLTLEEVKALIEVLQGTFEAADYHQRTRILRKIQMLTKYKAKLSQGSYNHRGSK